jgi:hypothetical protein
MTLIRKKELQVQRMNGNLTVYENWYDFRKELQRRSGVVLLNQLWLRIKPKAALPWSEFHMREALTRISGNILRLSKCPRCGGDLLVDRDIDGYYKRCIQCSFEIALPPGAMEQIDAAIHRAKRKVPSSSY